MRKCGKCNVGTIKWVSKGIYEWYACNHCGFKTEKTIMKGMENPYKRTKWT